MPTKLSGTHGTIDRNITETGVTREINSWEEI
jgi:hypothetical protein